MFFILLGIYYGKMQAFAHYFWEIVEYRNFKKTGSKCGFHLLLDLICVSAKLQNLMLYLVSHSLLIGKDLLHALVSLRHKLSTGQL